MGKVGGIYFFSLLQILVYEKVFCIVYNFKMNKTNITKKKNKKNESKKKKTKEKVNSTTGCCIFKLLISLGNIFQLKL